MKLLLTEEQKMLKQSAKKFFVNECNPTLARSAKLDKAFWKKLSDAGWATLLIAEEDGGSGSTLFEQGIVLEQAGYVLCSPVLYSTVHAALLCKLFDVKQSIQQLTAGKSAVFAMDELPATAETIATMQSDRTWTVTGEKAFVPLADQVDFIFVSAKTTNGNAVFLVEASDIEFRVQETFGEHGLTIVQMNDAKATCIAPHVSSEQLLSLRLQFAALQAIEMIGGMQSVIDQTVHYVSQRKQFDVPIGSFQAVQHHLANMYTAYRGARLLAYKALFLFDAGDNEANKFAHMAKAAANEAYRDITLMAHQLWGGNGYSKESDLQLWSNRAVTTCLTLGTSIQHKQALIELMKNKSLIAQRV